MLRSSVNLIFFAAAMISARDLFDALAALGGDGLGILHIAERYDGGAHPVDWDVAHVAARVFHRLGDGGRHFARLAATETDPALAVAHHRQCREAEDTTTLHDLGDAAHRDQFFLESITAFGGVFKTHHNEFP